MLISELILKFVTSTETWDNDLSSCTVNIDLWRVQAQEFASLIYVNTSVQHTIWLNICVVFKHCVVNQLVIMAELFDGVYG